MSQFRNQAPPGRQSDRQAKMIKSAQNKVEKTLLYQDDVMHLYSRSQKRLYTFKKTIARLKIAAF